MELGIDKCAVLHVKRGKVTTTENLSLMDNTLIPGLSNCYKYLGFYQSLNLDESENKIKIKNEYFRRVNIIMRTLLNAKNKINAINTWAHPVISYSFGVLSYSPTELQTLDRQMRTMLTKHQMLHPNSAIERLYLPRDQGGRGMLNLEETCKKEKLGLTKYFKTKNLPFYQTLALADKGYSPLNLAAPIPEKQKYSEVLRTKWKTKAMHGRFYASLHQQEADLKASNSYLTSGYLFPETEGALCAIQDQVVPTRFYKRHILKQPVETTTCRLCGHEEESVQHLISACTYLAPTVYTSRHNNMGKVVHQFVAQNAGLANKGTPIHKYEPKNILENSNIKIYWDTTIHTDRQVLHNRPDMVIINKTTKKCTIIDFAIPLDDNLSRSYKTKKDKYMQLADEIQEMWKMQNVEIKPLIISANGLVHKNTRRHLEELQVQSNALTWMQKAVVLGTTAIIRRTISRR